MMLKPDSNDPLKNRRALAMMAAFNAFFVFPYAIIALHVSDALGGSLLAYMGSMTAAPVGAYLFAAHKKDRKNDNPS